ncbi:MAG: TPM domain-containing protein [Calditrichaceae bacterium]
MNVKNFFTKDQKEKIIQAIKEAENETSGEIRIHLESGCKGDALERTVKIFQKLKMHETQLRNGTLIYLAVKDKKFAIYGDEGINEIVPENFWKDVKDEMRAHFSKGQFAEGIVAGTLKVGEKLKEYFPYEDDDVNELPDDISIGE